MSKKMISSDSMTTSVENRGGRIGVIQRLAYLPLSVKLSLLVIIALISRIIVLLHSQIITNDGMLYINMAKLFSEGKYAGTPGSYFNLYPFLIFLVQKLVGDWELSGQLISVTLGTLTVVPVFLLGRSLYDEKIGWLSGIFYITLPNLLKFDSQVVRDPTLWFFILFTMWFVWEGEKKNRLLLFALGGVSAGLGAITRVEGFVLWAALGFYIVFRKVQGISAKRKTLYLTLFVLIFPFLLSPVLLSLKKTSSQIAFREMRFFALSFIKTHTSRILNPEDPIALMGQKAYDSLPQRSQDSLELASRHRIPLAVSEVIYKFIKSGNLLMILILLGFWKKRKEGFVSSDKYLFFSFAVLFLMSVFYARQLYYFSTRHGLTLVLPCLFFAGHGLEFLVGNLSHRLEQLSGGRTFLRRYLFHIITVFLVLLFLAQGLPLKGAEKTSIKEVGLWLRKNGYQGTVVMGPKKFLRLAFYAEGRFVEMPDSWEKALESLRKKGVKIVTIDSCTIKQDCPDFLGNRPGSGLFLVQEVNLENEGCSIQILEFR